MNIGKFAQWTIYWSWFRSNLVGINFVPSIFQLFMLHRNGEKGHIYVYLEESKKCPPEEWESFIFLRHGREDRKKYKPRRPLSDDCLWSFVDWCITKIDQIERRRVLITRYNRRRGRRMRVMLHKRSSFYMFNITKNTSVLHWILSKESGSTPVGASSLFTDLLLFLFSSLFPLLMSFGVRRPMRSRIFKGIYFQLINQNFE